LKLLIVLMLILTAIGFGQKINVSFGELMADIVETDSMLVDVIVLNEGIRGVLGNWEMAPMSVMPDSTDGVGFFIYGNKYGPRQTFFGMDGSGQTFLETPGSGNIFLMSGPDCSNTIYWGAMPVEDMPNTDWGYLTSHYQFSLYYDPEFNVLKLRDSTKVIFEIDEDVNLMEIEQYDFNVWHDFTAGTIEALNGSDEAAWVVQVGDTIEIVGGVILNISHP